MFRNAKASKDVLGLWAPKQARQDKRIDALVCPLGSHAPKLHSLGRASLGDHHAPPIGHHRHSRREMFRIDDQQGLVDDLAVGCYLPWQALQGIGLGLDFDSADLPVDHRDIDAAPTVIEAEFVDYEGIATSLGVREQPPIGGLPDITVPKRSHTHVNLIVA